MELPCTLRDGLCFVILKETFPFEKLFGGRTRGENGEVLQRGSMTTTVEVMKDNRLQGYCFFEQLGEKYL